MLYGSGKGIIFGYFVMSRVTFFCKILCWQKFGSCFLPLHTCCKNNIARGDIRDMGSDPPLYLLKPPKLLTEHWLLTTEMWTLCIWTHPCPFYFLSTMHYAVYSVTFRCYENITRSSRLMSHDLCIYFFGTHLDLTFQLSSQTLFQILFCRQARVKAMILSIRFVITISTSGYIDKNCLNCFLLLAQLQDIFLLNCVEKWLDLSTQFSLSIFSSPWKL